MKRKIKKGPIFSSRKVTGEKWGESWEERYSKEKGQNWRDNIRRSGTTGVILSKTRQEIEIEIGVGRKTERILRHPSQGGIG